MKRSLLAVTALGLIVACGYSPAHAAGAKDTDAQKMLQEAQQMEADEDDTSALHDLIRRQNERIQSLENQMASMMETQQQAPAPAREVKSKDSYSLSKGSPKFSFNDGATTFEVHGRAQLDAAFFDDEGADLPDQTDIRRAYLTFMGQFDDVWQYMMQVDFANGVDFKDVWVAYTGFDNWTLKAGNQVTPGSLEQHTSSLDQSFVERSIMHDALYDGRNMGVSAKYATDQWSFGVGAFGNDVDEGDSTDDREAIVAARVTMAPLNEENVYLHLGGSAAYMWPNQEGADSTMRFNARPGSRLAETYALDTGNIGSVESATTVGLEAAMAYKTLALQGEYMRTGVSRDDGNDDVDFTGWYGQLSWMMTGEMRGYDAQKGAIKGVVPLAPVHESGFGAIELAARYAQTDLEDGAVTGGELETMNFAVNWYPHERVRFDLNYIVNDAKNSPNLGNNDPEAFVARAQFSF